VTYGLIAASADGWTAPSVLVPLLAGVALLGAFCIVELRSSHPMLPLSVFRSRQFSAANAVTFADYAALGGALFLVPVVLQTVSRYSPLEAGMALLPLTAIMLALSARSAALAARIGPRLQMSVGPLVIAAGMVLFTRVHGDGDYLTQVLPAVLVLGLGLAINVAPLTATALSAAPAGHAGIASAVNNPATLTSGFHTAVLIGAAVAAAGGILAALTIRNPPRPERPATGDTAADDLDCLHCGLEAPPLRSQPASRATRAVGPAPQ
jgi:hypothetical protein